MSRRGGRPPRSRGRAWPKTTGSLDPATLARLNDAVRAHQAGDLDRAAAGYAAILVARPGQPDALHLLGVVAHQRGDNARAEALIGKAIAARDHDPAFHNSLAAVLLAKGKARAATRPLRRAIALSPGYAEAHNNLGNALQALGALDEAVAAYRRALEARPGYVEALGNLGRACRALGDLDAAARAYREALSRRPGYLRAQRSLADILAEQGQGAEAEALFRSAIEADPDDAESRAALAALLERRGDLAAALAAAEAALAVDPEELRASLVAARCERRQGEPERALARLEALPAGDLPPESRAAVGFETGNVCDRLGDYRRAFRAYRDGNAALLATSQAARVDREAFPAAVRRLDAILSREWVAGWTPPVVERAEDPTPVFLVGFPRSGTTLLDQILNSHPGLATIEEKPVLDAVKARLVRDYGPYPACLPALDAQAIQALRAAYWQGAKRYLTPGADGRLVDKMPLNIVDAVLIHRLFPAAPILLALRHPADVVLSAFAQAFRPNPSMIHLADPGDAARTYAAVMGLWQKTRTHLPLNVVTTRYEDMVADMAAETARILAALGLPWDEAVRGYRDNARGRPISTPSYHQVIQPIYGRSVGRWRHYREELAAVVPVLEPFVAAFGYTLDDRVVLPRRGDAETAAGPARD